MTRRERSSFTIAASWLPPTIIVYLKFTAVLFRTDCGQQNDREKNETFHQSHCQGVIGISVRVSKTVGQPGVLLRGVGSCDSPQLICQHGECSAELIRRKVGHMQRHQ